jgi:hypothetical protein
MPNSYAQTRTSICNQIAETKVDPSALDIAGRTTNISPTRFFGDYAASVADNGYSCLPIPPRTKQTHWRKWDRFCSELPNPEQIMAWQQKYPAHGLAILCGWSCIAVDIDSPDVRQAKQIERLSRRILGDTPLKRIGRYPKRVLVYAIARGHVISSSSVCQVDLIGNNRYFVAFNLHATTGRAYRWRHGSPATVPLAQLPTVTPAQVQRFMGAVREYFSQCDRAPAALTGVQNLPQPEPQIHSSAAAAARTMDGRDGLLARLVWGAYARQDTPDAIAADAWAAFLVKADLSRPKRDGPHLWSHADALSKARYAITRPKPRPNFSTVADLDVSPLVDEWNVARVRFARRIDQLCVSGKLTRMDASISHAMLNFITSAERTCFASCETVAAQVGCRPATVKKARRQLRALGLWTARHAKGGRGILAHYRPQLYEAIIPEDL